MKKALRIFGALVVLVLVASCTTFQVSGIQVNKQTPSFQNIGQFEITVAVNELLGSSGGANLLNITSTVMEDKIFDAIRREIEKQAGDAAVNVTIRYEATALDVILNGLTGGIWAPAHAVIKGSIVKFSR